MVKRRNALGEILTRWEHINEYPNIYKDLRYCLGWEKKILDFVSKGDKEAENQIVLALNILKSANSKLKAAQKDRSLKRQLKRDGITVEAAIEICDAAVDFLEAANKDIKNIENRMKLEKRFVEDPNKENFDEFIVEWQKEILANDQLLKHIKKIVKKVKRRSAMWLDFVKISGGATVGMGSAGAGIAQVTLGHLGTTLAGAAVGAVTVFIGFSISLYQYYKSVEEIEIKDEELIEKIMSSKGIKTHWWGKLR